MSDEPLTILDTYDVLGWCRHRRKIAKLEQEHRNANSGAGEDDADYTTKWDEVIERVEAKDVLGILGAVELYNFERSCADVLRCAAANETDAVGNVDRCAIRSGRERICRSKTSEDPAADSGPIDPGSVAVRVTPGGGLAVDADLDLRERIARGVAVPDEDFFASPQWGPSFAADGEKPNTSVVSIGVRGFPDIQRHLRIDLGLVLTRAHHLDGDRVVVHMDDLSELASGFGVEFEFVDGRLIPLPLHVDDDGRELTEDELKILEVQ